MPDDHYAIRTMTPEETGIAVEWAAREGWNPGLHDAQCYRAADPDGFLVGLLDERPVAVISAVLYDGAFGFIGFYIVEPEFRGRGYGSRIWDAAMERLAGVPVGLDGVVEQQDNYRKSGFALAHRNVRYEGVGGGDAPGSAELVELSALPFETVDAYDRSFFPVDRSRFIEAWIKQPGCRALGILAGGRLAGYGVMRACRSGFKVGPLFADTPALAESLLLALKSGAAASDPVVLDVPEVNRTAVALAERHDMKAVFETARMYKGTVAGMPLDRIFGVTSFEVG